MNAASLSITSDIQDDGHYVVTIVQTGPDTASLDIKEQPFGTPPSIPPHIENTYELTSVRATGDHLTAVTSAAAGLQHPSIDIQLSQPGQIPSATLTVGHTWWSMSNFTKVMVLTQAQRDQADAFLKSAKFPVA